MKRFGVKSGKFAERGQNNLIFGNRKTREFYRLFRFSIKNNSRMNMTRNREFFGMTIGFVNESKRFNFH